MVVLWVGVVFSMSFLETLKPTPEKLRQELEHTDLKSLSGQQRKDKLKEVAKDLNRLPLKDRREVRKETMGEFFKQMTPEEQNQFIEDTLPQQFQQIVESINKMSSEDRRKMVQDALNRMKEFPPDPSYQPPPNPAITEDQFEQIAQVGLKTYLESSTPETKADLAPLMDEIQGRMQDWQDMRH